MHYNNDQAVTLTSMLGTGANSQQMTIDCTLAHSVSVLSFTYELVDGVINSNVNGVFVEDSYIDGITMELSFTYSNGTVHEHYAAVPAVTGNLHDFTENIGTAIVPTQLVMNYPMLIQNLDDVEYQYTYNFNIYIQTLDDLNTV